MCMKEPCRPSGEPPVCKELEMPYNRAMDRMIRLGHGRECPRDIIAYQELEIERYRNEIVLIRAENSKYREKVQLLENKNRIMEEIASNKNRLWKIGKNDVLILSARKIMSEENMKRYQAEMTARTGIKTVIFDGNYDIVGAIKNGT